jgi:hypothetical protein
MAIFIKLAGFWLFFFVLPLAGSAQAQTNPVAGQIQTGTNSGAPVTGGTGLGDGTNIKNIPELYPGEASDFGTQQLIKEKPARRKWVELDLDWQASYTDNYLLSTLPTSTVSGGKLQTTQMSSTWDLAFAPDPFDYQGMKLYPRAGFRQTFWNYGIGTGQNSNFAAFDFDVQTIYGELRLDLGDGWSTTVGGDWTRITASNTDSEIYRQVGPRWGAAKQVKINDYNVISLSVDQQMLFTEVASGQVETTGPSLVNYNTADNIYDRFNTTVGLSYIWSPVDQLFLTPYYRMTYSYYPQYAVPNTTAEDTEDRSDFVNTVGVSATYQINDNASARVFVSYEKRVTTYSNPTNDSTNSNVPEYSKFESGLGGSLTFRF